MIKDSKIRIVVDEERVIVEKLDAIARAEGITRSDVLRRAIRHLAFSSPIVPTSGSVPQMQHDQH